MKLDVSLTESATGIRSKLARNSEPFPLLRANPHTGFPGSMPTINNKARLVKHMCIPR